jgi:hypothetical protein
MAAHKGAKAAPQQQGVSFSLFLKALWIGQISFMPLPKANLG